ncbi:MAG: signal recognition particle protein, partial [Candidatus Aureabacteria bacterium]|nr:signal recognition particle protein [Candidatus Auribacterota bacterium]
MFNDLTQKFQRLFKNLRGHGKLTEKNIEDALRDVRLALLEADVNFKVVKQFIQKVKDGVLGSNVVTSVTPGQQFIKMLNNEMVSFLSGGEPETIKSNDNIILMTGLQGSGKTTTCGKLGLLLKRGGKKILMAACDIHRPAAIDQLEQVGKRLDIDVFADRALNDAVKIAEMAVRRFTDGGYDHLIVDTAGRLHVDSSMMEEIKKIKTVTSPLKIYFVADSCTGQDAVVSAESFHKALDFTGVILTKLDGDTRGGAAISIKHVTGRPVVYVGVGEKSQDFEVFYPDRMVSRILGMGDIVTLVEKSEEAFDKKEAERLIKKVKKNAL